jgi:hypothetical protein
VVFQYYGQRRKFIAPLQLLLLLGYADFVFSHSAIMGLVSDVNATVFTVHHKGWTSVER